MEKLVGIDSPDFGYAKSPRGWRDKCDSSQDLDHRYHLPGREINAASGAYLSEGESKADPMNQRLSFVALSVSNLDGSLRFYRDVLGLLLRDESHDSELHDPWYGGQHAAYSWTDGAFIHFALYPSHPPQRPVSTGAQIGFHVADFDAVHTRIVRAGFAVVQEPRDEPWGRTARYLDPDRNIVSITAN